MIATAPTCATCQHLDTEGAQPNYGYCRRYPPQYFLAPSPPGALRLNAPPLTVQCSFPIVNLKARCGEHEPEAR